jgi:hypothetical protein
MDFSLLSIIYPIKYIEYTSFQLIIFMVGGHGGDINCSRLIENWNNHFMDLSLSSIIHPRKYIEYTSRQVMMFMVGWPPHNKIFSM